MKSKVTPPASHDAISGRARILWEAAGSPDGEDLKHWLQAEKELNKESAASDGEYTGTSDKSVSDGKFAGTSDKPAPAPAPKGGNSRPQVAPGTRQQGKKS
jgi:hypothetical protein